LLMLIPGFAAIGNDTSVNNLLPSNALLNLATGFVIVFALGGLLILLTYLMAAFTAKKQALHDMMAKTLVLKK
jgi:uncharacterized RDD family membrane protein YckC